MWTESLHFGVPCQVRCNCIHNQFLILMRDATLCKGWSFVPLDRPWRRELGTSCRQSSEADSQTNCKLYPDKYWISECHQFKATFWEDRYAMFSCKSFIDILSVLTTHIEIGSRTHTFYLQWKYNTFAHSLVGLFNGALPSQFF